VDRVDLDLGQVRAFVAVTEAGHFGRAAVGLHLTQQSVSKRIQRLERSLGIVLLVRGNQGIALTPAGDRFLPHARRLLDVGDAAVADVRAAIRPVRVDVWGHLHSPLRIIREVTSAEPRLTVEVSMRRSLTSAIDELLRGNLDAAFGRVTGVAGAWRERLVYRLVKLEPIGLLMSERHPLAGATALRAADVAALDLWFPGASSSPELMSAKHQLAERFGTILDTRGLNLGLEHMLAELDANPTRAVPLTLSLAVQSDARVRIVPIADPAPCWPWCVVWRRDDRNPALLLLLDELAELSRINGWAEIDPQRHWLHDTDLVDLRPQRQTPCGT
jgi:DNA-binding transcriptional LysR family regulator